MAITTTCPNCQARFRLADEMAGKKVRCQKCNGIFEVPMFDGTMGSPTAPAPSSEPGQAEEAAAAVAVTVAPPPMVVAAPAPPKEEAEEENRRRDDDEDDDDAPSAKRRSGSRRPPRREGRVPAAKSGSSSVAILLAIAGLAVFFCVICSGVGVAVVALNDKPNQAKKDGFVKGPQDGFVNKQLPPVNVQPPQPGFANPININFGPNGQFRHDTQLTLADPFNVEGNRHKLYSVRMEVNRTYQIDMTSNQIDPYLIVVDDTNADVARNDDVAPGDLNSRIIFTPIRTGFFQIEATHCPPGANANHPVTGAFTLIVQRR